MVNHRSSTEHLVIRLDPEPDGHAQWVPVDAAGRPAGTIQGGPLADAAGLAARRAVSVLVPGERVLVTAADVPPVRGMRLRQALSFALEDQVAGDVEALHCVAGPRDAAGRAHIAAVDREWMRSLLERLQVAGITPDSVVPDFLALPWQDGECRVVRDGDRALVRDGPVAGFACEAQMLDTLLAARGHPATEPARPAGDLLTVLAPQAVVPALDLLEGEFGRGKRRQLDLGAWRLPAALAVALAVVMPASWLVQYRNVAAEHGALRAEIESLFAQLVPDEPMADPRAQIERRLGRGGSGSHELLLMLDATAAAFSGQPDLEISALAYTDGRLDLTVSARSAEQLDGLRERLGARNGLEAEIASASSRGERVEGRLSVRMGAT